MEENLEVVGLREIYKQADAEGRKKIISAATQLLEAQKILKDKEGIGNKSSEQDGKINQTGKTDLIRP